MNTGGSATPTGSVQFSIDNSPVGSAVGLSGGQATFSTTATQLVAGNHTISAVYTSDGNFMGSNGALTQTVNKATLTVTADAKSKTYDGAVFSPFTATLSGFVNSETDAGLRSSGALSGTLSFIGTATTAVNAGSYTITPTLGSLAATNYDFPAGIFVHGTLTIGQKAVTVTANNKSKTYGDANPALDATVNGTVNGDALNYSLATTATQFSNVGNYVITVTLGSNPNYSVTPNNGTLTIGRKAATVIANNKSKTYGDVNPTLDVTVSGTVNGDVLNYTLGTTATQFSNVGSYAITVTLGSNPNYSVTPSNGTLTIGQKAATVAANNKSKTYGDVNPALDATVSGTVNGDGLNYTLSTTAALFSTVGNYAIAVTLGSNPNYSVTPTNGTLTIGQKAATVTANNKSKTYGDANPALDATVSGPVNGDVLNYSLAATAGQFSSVGSYVITVTLGSNPNYNVTPSNGTLTIGQKAATVTANNKSKTYGDVNPTLDATVSGTVNSDVLNYSLSTTATQFSNVGSYTITVSLGSNPNYSVIPSNGALTIGQKAATVAANNKSKTYGDANPALDATVNGTVGELGLEPQLQRDPKQRHADDWPEGGHGHAGCQEQGLW